MRIVNLMPESRHFSYAGTMMGGRTIKSGESSPELPFDRLLLPLLNSDVEKGTIAIRLSDADRKLIDRLLKLDKKSIKVKTIEKKSKPNTNKSAKSKLQREPVLPMNKPSTPKGRPDIASVPPDGVGKNLDIGSLIKQNEMLRRTK